MNFVTYETALRLKEAGFPQPEKERLQIWYNDKGVPSIILNIFLARPDLCVFAPTADDILRELGENYTLCYSMSDNGKEWFCDNTKHEYEIHSDENPAEACALAWFEYFEMERTEFPENESES